MSEPKYTQEEEDMYRAWADYRSRSGVFGLDAHREFINGWYAAARDHQVELTFETSIWKIGYRAYWTHQAAKEESTDV